MSGNWHKQGNIKGKDGVGVPTGGQQGQALVKVGGSDHATAWDNINYADIDGKVPKSALPDLGNSTVPVASQAAMLNLPAVPGNQAIRTDVGKTFVLIELPASKLENWMEIVTTSDVQSVNGKTGNVTLTKADIGLDKVNNTADSDKPVATASVNGLMPKADKSLIAGATANATNNTLARRNATGGISFSKVSLSQAPSVNTDATTKAYVDDAVSTIAGGSTVATTDWDAMRTAASTGVVEGFVKGCPVGGTVKDNMSAGFVKDPVWRLEVRPEGLGYVAQRATLLNSVPRYMIGFVWERVYHPASARWTAWQCIGGDTGNIQSTTRAIASPAADEPFRHADNSAVRPYTKGSSHRIRRVGASVYLSGCATTNREAAQTHDGIELGWFILASEAPTGTPGTDKTLFAYGDIGYTMHSIQHGSGTDNWATITTGHSVMIARYTGAITGTPWLPFSLSYPAPPLNTYGGAGTVIVPPEIPPQSVGN